jgi:glycosyltransferase involved in cell wall biosynthesis
MARPVVAFYAPMKAPDHPVPSGDRQIARLTLRALERAGFAPRLVSRLRVLDVQGCPKVQARLLAEAEREATRGQLVPAPALWFTYHCHYKAPDLLGPPVARALGIPYAISEPSVSARRRDGAWAMFARASEAAIAAADRLFWTTARDRPGLEDAGHGAKMAHLPAFLDEGPAPAPRPAGEPPRLLTVAMMRPGDKLESYRRLAASLAHLTGDWRLEVVGDGEAEGEVRALLGAFADRVTFRGRIEGPATLRAAYEAADLMLWPGVGEGVGMALLEAQAAGLPVVSEDHPAQRDLVEGPLVPPGDPVAFARAVEAVLAERAARGVAARARVEARHGLDAAAAVLRRELGGLLR